MLEKVFSDETKKRIAAILTVNMMPRDGWKLDWKLISDRVFLQGDIYYFHFTDGGCWPIARSQFEMIKQRHDREREQALAEVAKAKQETNESIAKEPAKVPTIDERFIYGSDKQKKWAIAIVNNLQQRCDRDYYLGGKPGDRSWDDLSEAEQDIYNNYLDAWRAIANHPNRTLARYWIHYGKEIPLRHDRIDTIDNVIYRRIPEMVNEAKARAIAFENDKRGDRS